MDKTILIFFLGLGFLGFGVAQAQEAMSLKDAAKLALGRNPSIAAAGLAQEQAASRIEQARSGLLPKVNYSESWTRSDNPVFVFSSLLTQHQFGAENFQIGPLNRPDFLNNFQSQLVVDQSLYDAGKSRGAIKMAELGKSAAQEDTRRTQMSVIAQVAERYYDAQLAAERLKAAEQSMRSVQADLAQAEARVAAGMATDVDVLSIRVHLAMVKEEQIRRAADLDVARAAINDAIGLELDAQHALTTVLVPLAIPVKMLAAFESDGTTRRPEAQQAKLAKELADVQAADTRRNLFPQVALRGAFEADRQRFYDRGGANWLISIGLRWNLFNGFADRSRIQEAQTAVRRSNSEQERANSAIRLEVRRAYAELNASQQRITAVQASVEQAEESLRISQNRYSAGLSTITDLLRTEMVVLDARTRYLAAIHDQRIAAARLELAAGTLSADSEVLN